MESEVLRIQLELLKDAAVVASGVARASKPRVGWPQDPVVSKTNTSGSQRALPLPSQRVRVGKTRRERKVLWAGDAEGARAAAEEEERARYASYLGQLIKRCGMPLALVAAGSDHEARLLESAAGNARARTLRMRIRT
eukprot:11404356-Karenia_brevis.AAC.1